MSFIDQYVFKDGSHLITRITSTAKVRASMYTSSSMIQS